MGILKALGLAPSDRDKLLTSSVSNSYTSLRVVGRGTVYIDPQEVRLSEEFKEAKALAKIIVDAQ